jgi:hypothetical protein
MSDQPPEQPFNATSSPRALIQADQVSGEESIIHALNIEGEFFERSCQATIDAATPWRVVDTKYPVEFPSTNGPWRGEASELDIRAQLDVGEYRLTLLVECKKRNPEFINWVCFLKHPNTLSGPSTASIRTIDTIPQPARVTGWRPEAATVLVTWPAPLANEAKETRGKYDLSKKGDTTKTANVRVRDTACQVVLATQAILEEEVRFCRALSGHQPAQPPPYKKHILIPTIVTTANLFICGFNPADIDVTLGEIPRSKATLSPRSHLLYEYPLPRSLQAPPSDLVSVLTTQTLDFFTRMPILVVNSGALRQILEQQRMSAPNLFRNLSSTP